MTLHPPPRDPAELAAFPSRVLAGDVVLARIHQENHAPEWFCACGNHRFDSPIGSRELFGTCYLAEHPITAFIEKFGDLRLVSQERVDAHQLSFLQVPSTRLADLTDRRGLGSWGVTGELATGSDYAGAQEWAQQLFQAGFGGLWYTARHDPQGELRSIALFGAPGLHPEAFSAARLTHVGEGLIEAVRVSFGIEVLPTTWL